jgi:hypothetical protein
LTEKHASVRGKNEMHIIVMFFYYLESDECAWNRMKYMRIVVVSKLQNKTFLMWLILNKDL